MVSSVVKKVAFLIGLTFFATACGSDPVALNEEEIKQLLIGEGIDEDVAECVASVEIRSTTEYFDDDTNRNRIDATIKDCREAQAALEAGDTQPNELANVDDAGYGDDPILDALWDDCEEGDGVKCDELFNKSPIGSEYENFGLTCGDRPEVLHCSELQNADEIDPTPRIATGTTSATIDE